MPMLSSVLGFSGFGLLVRFWQLGILKRNLAENLPAHAAYMAGFGFIGYWAERYEVYSNDLIAQKKDALQRIRQREVTVVESLQQQQRQQTE